MTIEPEFSELMVDAIAVEKIGARTFYTDASFSAKTTYQARVVRKNRMVRTDSGEEKISRTQAWVFGAPGIETTDRVTLPDGTTPLVMAVERYPDEHGAHHEIVFFGGG